MNCKVACRNQIVLREAFGWINSTTTGSSSPQWSGLDDWEQVLGRHYETAERMLGVTPARCGGEIENLSRELATHFGAQTRFKNVLTAVCFGTPGSTNDDPYFGGKGPPRTGCKLCGACMVGCRHGAKNTLVKNYLWFAENNGVTIQPERTVTSVEPLGKADGTEGYAVTSQRTGAWIRSESRTITAKGVVFAAGALGTNRLLARCKLEGHLPRVSDRLGEMVRTNSEAVLAVTLPDDVRDITRTVAITSSVYPDEETHIEMETYGKNADFFGLNFTVMVGAMQPLDNAIRFCRRRGMFGGVRLTTEQDPAKPTKSFIPLRVEAADWLAKRTRGTPQGVIMDSFFNTPTTAHILGGAPIGSAPASGVVDKAQRVFGYRNRLICDGSVMPANPAVNPSLTITAMSEHAMSLVPPLPGHSEREGIGMAWQRWVATAIGRSASAFRNRRHSHAKNLSLSSGSKRRPNSVTVDAAKDEGRSALITVNGGE